MASECGIWSDNALLNFHVNTEHHWLCINIRKGESDQDIYGESYSSRYESM